ncbi:MAG TPA: N-acetylmuramoyl-L-alanine amidase [Spirochaetota bacterium]|nr:N-acetylmuramoyl-L-alanine amidase [Spirochaetota bacterium]HOM38232.1 N-acetylmuramoyl-L-alanine amidase [Spirochaetota bacterium]HPQ48550.1 N-acetylmuramoyl-L-alanine amidase [Spirochaetota bacterium]
MKFFIKVIIFLLSFEFLYPLTIVIDPGHGGKDPGAIKNGIKEKEINLKVALLLKKIIKDKIPKVRVILTRDTDTYLSLQERVDIANNYSNNNAIFISIHTNSHDKNEDAKGIEIYYFDNSSEKILKERIDLIDQKINIGYKDKIRNILNRLVNSKLTIDSKRLANNISYALNSLPGMNIRFVKPANFFVSSYVLNPSVLIEIGFINEYSIKKDSYLFDISTGIVIGILNFYKENKFF